MNIAYIYEFLGTFILILLGDGVVANTVLRGTKSEGAGWLTITIGWGLAVFMGVIVAGPHSGAHINPAVTIGLATAGLFPWSMVPGYIAAQLLGGFTGGVVVYLFFKQHFNRTEDLNLHLGVFCTGPAIRKTRSNLFSEIIGTFVLVLLVLYIAGPSFAASNIKGAVIGLGSIGALPVALVVMGIGISLGGTTGYAINPARDLGPRIAYAVLPFHEKRDADWGYSWIPVIGPILGAIIAAVIFLQL
ncbi:MIP/aquaporin family protein [Prolixibacter sp. SD074]|jgi:glycerol uptake facilitator protein|uniref:MIP/aquaporin family protein n=1 Tax=Prolixibacter sp. SD074 TaxID=2652391 RepID=UPI001287E135|nr:MIP/aquaporin family protein [Prolixibacter sp. SD074]GET29948.1 putative glycerol uptake facilitator protein [Prolixibacter sp. SD074]